MEEALKNAWAVFGWHAFCAGVGSLLTSLAAFFDDAYRWLTVALQFCNVLNVMPAWWAP
jgi:hypothetical protein